MAAESQSITFSFLLSKLAESDEYRTALLNQALKPRVFAELAKHYMGNYLAQVSCFCLIDVKSACSGAAHDRW